MAAYFFALSLSGQITVAGHQYSDGVPGRGYSKRFEYDGEEIPITLRDEQGDVNMEGPFKLRYITFRHGKFICWCVKVEEQTGEHVQDWMVVMLGVGSARHG